MVKTLNKFCCQNLFSGRFALYDNFKVRIILHQYILELLLNVLGFEQYIFVLKSHCSEKSYDSIIDIDCSPNQ